MSDIDTLTDAELHDLRQQVADAGHMQRDLAAFGRWLEQERDATRAKAGAANSRTHRRAVNAKLKVLDEVAARYGQIEGST